ncbi:N-acetylmuramoyl-L-alanine amidase [Streptomyces sp. NPDC006798]|uniref:peptidoglycan recognition protein family protein n=1 Tax=Streptomyces sp. NPDC006798 TaxID=3155462 RepID=UPI0033D4D0DC
MSPAHRRPARRGLLVLGGGFVLAPVSAAAFLVATDRTAPRPSAARPQSQDAPRPRFASAAPPPRPSGWMDGVARKPITGNFTPEGRTAQRGLILHVQEGEGSLHERFSTPAYRSSAHFWVSQAGEIEQYVSIHDRAWTQRAGNAAWASIETSGFARNPLTGPQVEAVARVYTWGVRVHGWPVEVTDSPDGAGLGTHSMGDAAWGGHACPGTLRSAQRTAVMDRVRRALSA